MQLKAFKFIAVSGRAQLKMSGRNEINSRSKEGYEKCEKIIIRNRSNMDFAIIPETRIFVC